MNRPTTAKEALIAEALGDMAALIERLETLAPELQASRQALVLSHKELVNEVAIFKAQMTEVPDGQVKFPHPWPPQIPPGRTVGL